MASKPTYEKFRASRAQDFVTDLKLVIRKHVRRGNEALPLEGGDSSTYGELDDDELGRLLIEAGNVLNGEVPKVSLIDFLYHYPPLPKRMTVREAKEWLKTLAEE